MINDVLFRATWFHQLFCEPESNLDNYGMLTLSKAFFSA